MNTCISSTFATVENLKHGQLNLNINEIHRIIGFLTTSLSQHPFHDFLETSFSQRLSNNVYLTMFFSQRLYHNVFITTSFLQRLSHNVFLTYSSSQSSLYHITIYALSFSMWLSPQIATFRKFAKMTIIEIFQKWYAYAQLQYMFIPYTKGK